MGQFVWLMVLWRMQAEWRSASMECGEQCVIIAGITMMPESCADNWGYSVNTGGGELVHSRLVM